MSAKKTAHHFFLKGRTVGLSCQEVPQLTSQASAASNGETSQESKGQIGDTEQSDKKEDYNTEVDLKKVEKTISKNAHNRDVLAMMELGKEVGHQTPKFKTHVS